MRRKMTAEEWDEIMDWLLVANFTSIVTLTIKDDRNVDDAKMERLVGKLVSRYAKKTATGPRSKKKIIMAPFLEHTAGGVPHLHILFRLEEDKETSKALLRDIWTSLDEACGDPLVHDKTGEEWYKEIPTAYDRRRVGEYVTKQSNHDFDVLLVKYTYLGPDTK